MSYLYLFCYNDDAGLGQWHVIMLFIYKVIDLFIFTYIIFTVLFSIIINFIMLFDTCAPDTEMPACHLACALLAWQIIHSITHSLYLRFAFAYGSTLSLFSTRFLTSFTDASCIAATHICADNEWAAPKIADAALLIILKYLLAIAWFRRRWAADTTTL